ncbi:uncharacterized protein DS421_12g368320 [Arachis hypogaea]|nr:uncharacterized protein DS421_12g368320 [Arachis hypogaea]
MEIGNGGRRGGLSYPSHDSHGSRASMRMRRKTYDESYFYGLKTMIKKSRTAENLDRLFHACQRYRVSGVEKRLNVFHLVLCCWVFFHFFCFLLLKIAEGQSLLLL